MYIRQDHQLNELDAMHALVDAHALGAWVVQAEDGLVANHLPFLLERGKGRRLRLSGVNKDATREDVLTVTGGVKPVYDCCVDLGYTAADTRGNAAEIAEWAKGKGYDSLIVVTSDYHMPRAMLLIRSAMPDAKLTPYPVVTGLVDVRHWWRRSGDARRLSIEYCKYLAILTRESVRSLGKPSHKTPPPKADAKGTKP